MDAACRTAPAGWIRRESPSAAAMGRGIDLDRPGTAPRGVGARILPCSAGRAGCVCGDGAGKVERWSLSRRASGKEIASCGCDGRGGVGGDRAHLGRGRLRATPRTISAAVVPRPTWARPARGFRVPRLARARAPPPPARAPRWAPRLGARSWRAFLGAGMPLPAPAPAALPPVVTMDGEGKRAHRSASSSTSRERWRGAGAGTGSDRAEKALLFFLRGAADARRNARCRARRELRSIARTSALFALPSLSLSLSRRPAGLAPWGASVGAWGRGDGTRRSVAWSAVGVRAVAAEAFRRSDACGSVAAPRKRARDGRCGRTHVLLLRPLLGHLLELFHCGVGWAGRGRSARVRARLGARRRGAPEAVPALVFPGARKQITAVESAPAIGGLAMFRAWDSLSIRAFVAASMSPPYFLSMATTSSSPWPVIGWRLNRASPLLSSSV